MVPLDSYAVTPGIPERLVPNPGEENSSRRRQHRETAPRRRSRPPQARNRPGRRESHAREDPAPHDPDMVRLDAEAKLITHAIRMAAYNTEATLARAGCRFTGR